MTRLAVALAALITTACSQEESAPAPPPVPTPEVIEAPLPPGEAPPIFVAGVTSYRIGEPATAAEIAMRIRPLWQQPEWAGLRIEAVNGGTYVAYTPAGVADIRAAEIGRTLKSQMTAVPVPPGATIVPHLVRSNVTNILRQTTERGAAPVRIQPRGSIAVLLQGVVEQTTSVYGERGDAYVVMTPEHAGWGAARAYRDYDDCMPSIDVFLNDVAPDRRDAVARDAWISTGRVRTPHGIHDGYMVVGRDVEQARSYFGAYRETDDCGLTRVGFTSLSGFIEDGFLTGTEKQRGETLLVVAWHPSFEVDVDGLENWAVLAASTGATVWSIRARSSRVNAGGQRQSLQGPLIRGPNGRDGFWPIRVASPNKVREYFYWNGQTLVSDGIYVEDGYDEW